MRGTVDISAIPGSINHMLYSGGYVYAIGFGTTFGRILIFDVSTPTAPALVGDMESASIPSDSARVGVLIGSTFLSIGDDIYPIDVSTPSAPALTGTPLINANGGIGAAVSGSAMFLTSSIWNGVRAIDVTTPAAPTLISTLTDGTLDISNPGRAIVKGSHLIFPDYNLGAVCSVDISNPASMTITQKLINAAFNSCLAIDRSGNYAYVGGGFLAGVSVADITNPAAMTYAGGATTQVPAEDVCVGAGKLLVPDVNTTAIAAYDISSPPALTLIDAVPYTESVHADAVGPVATNGAGMFYVVANAGDSLAVWEVV